jgi:hypothetical protein
VFGCCGLVDQRVMVNSQHGIELSNYGPDGSRVTPEWHWLSHRSSARRWAAINPSWAFSVSLFGLNAMPSLEGAPAKCGTRAALHGLSSLRAYPHRGREFGAPDIGTRLGLGGQRNIVDVLPSGTSCSSWGGITSAGSTTAPACPCVRVLDECLRVKSLVGYFDVHFVLPVRSVPQRPCRLRNVSAKRRKAS